jgi:tetratricopeptide (TPR) repeat protein
MGKRRPTLKEEISDTHFSPREFLKARRPERFSDSEPITVPVLDRSMLEYHLGTLTSRSQEADFARFALRLAEREVCPNLLPQTGPTGGGDSKVDTETYPVADGLSLIWYSGIGREASSERWAFAFSAKKDWRAKVKSDVAKIAATARGYTKAFFVTNQFVPDKARADVEDKLRAKHKIDVRILDRTWILDKVFGNRHELLAIDELRLSTSIRAQVQKGPLDLQREAEIASLEDRIKAAAQSGEFTVVTVGDCLVAAELARGLDRPRIEVEDRYARAERLAKEFGTQHQQLECAYEKAWTTFWWYEDYKAFAGLYREAERLAKGSRNAYEIELLHNLWMLLYAATKGGNIHEPDAKLSERTSTLTRELDRLSSEANRPSTVLQARTLKLLMRLLAEKRSGLDSTLRDLTAVIDQCEGLVGYPLEKLADTLLDLGDYIGTQPAYGGLFEKITEVVAKRKGEVVAARMLMKRGSQELRAGRPYEAIRCLGRSLTRLHKHESRHDAVKSLMFCGSAYERAGLYWAARGSCLAAAALAVGDFWTYSEITPLQAACYNHLKWLELRLGRVPQALAWHEVSRVVTRTLIDKGDADPGIAKGDVSFDAILGILFLRTDLWYLPRLSRLPDGLQRLELFNSSVALLYALGHEELVPDDLVPDKSAGGKLKEFFAQWRDQPAAEELPDRPALYDGLTVELTSKVLGCQVVVESDNNSPCVELAESVVAALESFAATGHSERVMAREPVLTIKIRKAELAAEPFEFELQDRDGRLHVLISCREFSPHQLSREAQGAIRSRLLDLLAGVAGRVFLFGDPDRALEKLIKEELAIDRSVNFTSSFGTVGNVLGDSPNTSLAAWSHEGDRNYPLKRTEVWDEADRRARGERFAAEAKPDPHPGQGPPPPNLFHPERTRHSEMQTISLIREALWERAGWGGLRSCGSRVVQSRRS